jgi:hypothetical protein
MKRLKLVCLLFLFLVIPAQAKPDFTELEKRTSRRAPRCKKSSVLFQLCVLCISAFLCVLCVSSELCINTHREIYAEIAEPK